MPFKDPEQAKQYGQDYYQRNKEKMIAQARERSDALKEEIRFLKESTPCADCENLFSYYVMHFDHLDGREKTGNVSKFIISGQRKRAFEEMEKCELVCANCHAIRTFNRAVSSSPGSWNPKDRKNDLS